MRRITAGTLLMFFALRRGCWWRPSVLWLAAMLFALRALLPTGFMPNPDALRAGRFELVYCSASGPMPAGMAMAAHGMADPWHSTGDAGHGAGDGSGMAGMQDMAVGIQAGHMRAMAAGVHANHLDDASRPDHAPVAPDGATMPADCPFGLTGVYTCLPPLPAVMASILALVWRVPVPSPVPSPLPGITDGPPVGSRAPPPSLA